MQEDRAILCAVAGHVYQDRSIDPPSDFCHWCGKARLKVETDPGLKCDHKVLEDHDGRAGYRTCGNLMPCKSLDHWPFDDEGKFVADPVFGDMLPVLPEPPPLLEIPEDLPLRPSGGHYTWWSGDSKNGNSYRVVSRNVGGTDYLFVEEFSFADEISFPRDVARNIRDAISKWLGE
jgi:hypothetical protein